MGKIIICDYDDTLKPIKRDKHGNVKRDDNGNVLMDIKQLELNIGAIKKFRKAGGIFVLSTGRPFSSIKKEVKKYKIPVDYLGCNDGSSLYDNDLNLLKEYFFSNAETNYIDKKLETVPLEFSKDNFGKKFPSQYHCDITGVKNKEEIIEKFMNDFDECSNVEPQYTDFKYVQWLLIRPRAVTKITTGFDVLMYHPEIKIENVIAIGDGSNDIPMLEKYNGYAISHSNAEVKEICQSREVASVKALIKML